MKLIGIIVLFPLLLVPAMLSGQQENQKIAASAFLDAVIDRDWDRLQALSHVTLWDRAPREKWVEMVNSLEKTGGKILGHSFHSIDMNASYANIVHRMYFEKDSLAVRLVVDSLNLVGGFWLEAVQREYRYPPPHYAHRDTFSEIDVTIGEVHPLPGTISIPDGEGPFPAVVLVHGSGPSDKDQTIAGNKMFRDIAWGLASRGIMVLRYDKRTKVYGKSMNLLELTVQEETIDDAVAALAVLRAHSDADTSRIILIGHSLGASVAPEIATLADGVKGLVMLAPIARPLELVVMDQLQYVASQQDTLTQAEQIKLNEELEKAARIHKGELDPKRRLLNVPALWYYDLNKRDQKAFARDLGIPIFIARAEKDYQSPQMEHVLWQQYLEGIPDVVFRTYRNCYHLFIETDARPGPWNYQQEGHVSEVLIDDLVRWCSDFAVSRDN